MTRKLLRWTLIGLIAMVGLASAAPLLGSWFSIEVDPPKTLQAEPTQVQNGWCEKKGVSVVIDFGAESGLAPITRCVIQEGLTGWDVLVVAGLEPKGTAQYPTGFVCRISGMPSPTKQDCLDTPTYKEGTWAYYTASKTGGSLWFFSGAGSSTRKPDCGSVEGWLFKTSATDDSTNGPRVEPQPIVCRN
jgi:hypothetical protein